MMPPLLHVCNGLASHADAACLIYHERGDIIHYVAASVWRPFEFSVISCSLVPGTTSPNAISSSVGGSDYLHQISLKSIQYSYKAKNADVGMRDRDILKTQ